MAAQHPTATPHKTPTPAYPPLTPAPHPIITRGHVVATRSPGGGPTQHPAVYKPWTQLQTQAAARLKTELSAALRDLEQAMHQAAVILDTTSAYAAEAAGTLEAAGWAAWHKYMEAADTTRNQILNAARTGYDQAITYAHDQYAAALADAEKTFTSMMNDAGRAKADAEKITA